MEGGEKRQRVAGFTDSAASFEAVLTDSQPRKDLRENCPEYISSAKEVISVTIGRWQRVAAAMLVRWCYS